MLAGEAVFQAAFAGKKMMVSLMGGEKMFDIGLAAPMTDQRRISTFAEQVMLVYNIIDAMGRAKSK